MTLLELREKADARLVALWQVITAKQERYLQKNGRYWQGILTPSVMPTDGIDKDIDLTSKPHYQTEDWNYLELPIDSKIPFQIRIDQYICPDGEKGFQATIFVMFESKIYSRSKGVGKDSNIFDYNWKELIKE